ncbi:MAG: NAD-dependent epimerase/dehydratase family protein [Nanoarchaeota archaeon]
MSKYLIIGGLGFLGSNLTRGLIKNNEEVTILTDTKEEIFKLHEVRDKPKIIEGSILNINLLKKYIKNQDFIINFAALLDPKQDPNQISDIDIKGQENILEACNEVNKNVKIIFPSSRLVYGKPQQNLVKETHPLNPQTQYAKNKAIAESIYQNSNINSVIIRMPQPYGPGQQIKHHVGNAGFIIGKALRNETINIFGNGQQLRDYIFVKDIAKAITQICKSEKTNNQIYNIGTGIGTKFKDFVTNIIEISNSGKFEHVPYPEDKLENETGSCVLDISKIKKDIGWSPETSLKEGLQKTINYYKENLNLYL